MEVGSKWAPPTLDSLGPNLIAEDSSREQKFYEDALKCLPKPMQTLLRALKDLKCDIVKDLEIKKENEFNLFTCKITELVSKVLLVVEAKSKFTNDFSVPIQKQFEDLNLTKDFLKFCPNTIPENWLEVLEKQLSAKRKIYYELLENKKSYITRQFDSEASILGVEHAVNSSEALRRRLITLAQGPLSCLFEDIPKTESVKKEEEISFTNNTSSVTTNGAQLQILTDEIKELSIFITLVRTTLNKLNSQKFLDLTQTSLEAIESIRIIRKSVAEPIAQKAQENFNLTKADKKIQAEISLLLATLTVDRQSLETVLRSIKSQCEYLKNKYEYEFAAEIFKILKQIQATYSSANQIFLNSCN